MGLTSFVFGNDNWAEPDLFVVALANGQVIRATNHNTDLVNPADGFTYYHALYGAWERGSITYERSTTTDCDVTLTADTTVLFPGTTIPILWLAKLLARARVTISTCVVDITNPYVIVGSTVVFVGRVNAPSVVSTQATLTCTDESYLFQLAWPQRVICSGCPFTLFDRGCTLLKDNFGVQCVVGAGSIGTSLVLTNNNMLVQSNKFESAPWVLTNAVVGAHGAIAPDGTNNAYVLQRTATLTTEASVTQIAAAVAGGTNLDHAVYAKAGTAGVFLYLRIIYADASIPTGVVVFNLTTGAIAFTGTTFTGKATITALPNGWYRCAIHAASITTPAANRVDIGCTTSSIGGLGGNAGDFIAIWGAQLEVGTAPSTYTATTTAAQALGTIGNDSLPYTKGYIVPTSGQATGWPVMVTTQVDTSHLSIAPFAITLAVGDAFTLYPGCNGTASACQFKYGNNGNYGGFTTVPGPNNAIVGA